MSQLTFGDAEYAGKGKTARRERFLTEMDQVVPWKSLLGLIEPFYPEAGRGRQAQNRVRGGAVVLGAPFPVPNPPFVLMPAFPPGFRP